MTDSIIESIVGGKEEYSTQGKDMGEAAKMAALELIKAIEMRNADRVVSAFQALMIECEMESDDEEEGAEIEIKL